MPGLIDTSGAMGTVGAAAGMKRALAGEAGATHAERALKKRKVEHRLQHTQPIERIVEFISTEHDGTGTTKEFFDKQLQRAIAVECRAAGFDVAEPQAMERFRAMTDIFMRTFLAQVRKSMSSARRTTSVPHDWIYALKSIGIEGSSMLEKHLDTGTVPPSLLQPPFEPPVPADPPPPDLEALLGPELSGREEKESRKYIPPHLPPFPPKHAWKATPVFTPRENDPRRIREKATEEGILAEQSLRKLMAAQKAGLQGSKTKKQRKSARMKESEALWQEAMEDVMREEEKEAEHRQYLQHMVDQEEHQYEMDIDHIPKPAVSKADRGISLQEGVHINYEQKFMRQAARGL
ncbi:uncharacterized protein EI97DRAFT_468370 [Westerdykella ornata]|uniref:Transcription initiation factor TFIID subunit 8 n=1 Tax=Westerdykella ornata TaxID=318751 RepID=A0A6A6JFW9_WESOR|nr:uncharacterized protein EI97DRAFT_468370 [Westerdykella ornata]KAF2275114.1 hypothetical protein EI97DRAFT_468370 [Westerdykella ornata]